ncbi:hypothetical protein P245_06440 [Comamonas thiooxydans]|uniref:Uncharacterized protein n=1 Tax=Comamonas thiooxydans TaxID=363952 RepID=A0A0E3BIU8_9BURK|nr:hypothetical protein P245_06440 [Comamonas thiooxydans]
MSALERFLSLLDDEYDPGLFERTIKPASACPPPDCMHRVPASVFDLATREVTLNRPLSVAAASDKVMVITRDSEGLRCRYIPFAESAEGMEKEFQRRARQVVPRPTRQKSLHLKNSRNWKQIDADQDRLTGEIQNQNGESPVQPQGAGPGPTLQPVPCNA